MQSVVLGHTLVIDVGTLKPLHVVDVEMIEFLNRCLNNVAVAKRTIEPVPARNASVKSTRSRFANYPPHYEQCGRQEDRRNLPGLSINFDLERCRGRLGQWDPPSWN